jgi:hypothetical protein
MERWEVKLIVNIPNHSLYKGQLFFVCLNKGKKSDDPILWNIKEEETYCSAMVTEIRGDEVTVETIPAGQA